MMSLESTGTSIMDVGAEEQTPPSEGKSAAVKQAPLAEGKYLTQNGIDEVQSAWDRYWTWLGGMFISCIPIAALPIFLLLMGRIPTFLAFFAKIFYQSDIVYLVISLSIAAINDERGLVPAKFRKIWQFFMWFLIVLGAFIFGMLTIGENEEMQYNSGITIILNTSLFVFALIIGSVPYIASIVVAKKARKEAA